VAKSCVTVCFTYSSQGSVVTQTHLGHGGVFKYDFVTNFLLSLTMREIFENRLKCGEVMGKSLVSCFLTHSVDIWGNILFWGRIQIPIWYKVVVLCGVPRTITISIYLVTQVTIYQHFTQTDGQLSQLKKITKNETSMPSRWFCWILSSGYTKFS